MRFWGTRKRQAAYSRLLVEIADNEVVRTAEELVAEAWMETLSEVEEQAAFATKVCTHMRDTAFQVFRSAQSTRDALRIESSQRELTASQQALARIRDQHDGVLRFVGGQRTSWAKAAKDRALAALQDRERLVEAARGARVRAMPLLDSGA